jgi:tetratricopeptide (TPR) repeat protein
LLSEVTSHCIKTRRTKEWAKFLDEEIVPRDPSAVYYQVEILIADENYTQALTQLAHVIKQNPTTAYFLQQQVRSFCSIELFEYAQRIAKITVDLCPESFESWFYFAKACFGLGEVREALIAIDLAPMTADLHLLSIPLRLENSLQVPFNQNNTDYYSYIMAPRKDFMDFG